MGAQEIHPWTYGGKDVINLGPSVIPVSDAELPDIEPDEADLQKIESGLIDEPTEPAEPPADAVVEDQQEAKPKAGKVPPA